MQKSKLPTIGIIGGGILGLTLAYRLSKNGFNVSIIEKSPILGGLASGLKIENQPIEKYYHHFFKSDIDLQNLLTELNIGDAIQWIPSKMGLFDGKSLLTFSSALDILTFPKLNIFNRLRLGLVSFYLQKTKNIKQFEKWTAFDWCNKYYGKTVTDVMWRPLLESKFEGEYKNIAMTWFWTRIHDRSSSRDFPTKDEKLGYIDGSFNKLIQSLEEKIIDQGGEIYKNSSITNYTRIKDIHKIEFKSDDTRQSFTKKFDIVVSTIPPKHFIQIFNPPKKYAEKLKKIKFIGAYCFILTLKNSLSKFYWTSVNDTKSPFVALVEHTNFVEKSKFNNKTIVYLGKYTDNNSELFKSTKEELLQKCVDYLKKINPAFDEQEIESVEFFKSPEAQHIATTDFEILSYKSGVKGLLFAHFAQIFPHDRGTNYAIAQANELFNMISSNKWN